MRVRLSIGILCLAVFALAGVVWGQTMHPRVEVDFHHPVNVGENTTLPPGHYIFQQLGGLSDIPVFQVTKPNGENVTLTAIGMSARAPEGNSDEYPPMAKHTDVVLQKLGGTYYLDKIWVRGGTRGWAFDIPESAKSQVSQMQQEIVPGTYSEMNESAAKENSENNGHAGTTAAANNSSNQETNSSTNPSLTNPSAQNSQKQYSSTASNTEANQEQSLTGCLQRASSASSYYLQAANGSPEAQILPAADLDSQMADQVGHTVRLIGQWTGNTVPNSANSQTGMQAAMSGGNMMNSSMGMNGTSMDATAQAGSGFNSNIGTAALASQQFQVTRIDVISDQCSR
jgi:hypothetical protein